MTDEWVGEGFVLPISRFVSDGHLMAAARVKSLLVSLREEASPAHQREISSALRLIVSYWEKPRMIENHKNEMAWREEQMRRLGWAEQKIEEAQACYDELANRSIKKL